LSQSFVSHNEKWRNLVFVFALTAALWIVHAVWLAHDTRPPLWDMAAHQTYALNYLPGDYGDSDLSFLRRSWNYPPFVHIAIASVFWLFHTDPHIAILANIPATFLLFWAVFEFARMFSSAAAARWTCILVALTPYLIWMSRETVLDYWLSAWVAVSLVFLVKSKGFESKHSSLLFGLSCALGLLTKWFFAAFLAAPAAYLVVRHRVWRTSHQRSNFFIAALLAGIVAGSWYLPNLPEIIRFWEYNSQIGAKEGEPPILSFQSCIYYLRLLEGYQLFALLFCLVLLSCFFMFRSRGMGEKKLWALIMLGGWLAMTALRTKDPRFTMPLLGPMLVIAGVWIESWGSGWKSRLTRAILVMALGIQAYAINFGISWLPQEIILVKGYQGSLRWDWNLYIQHYFHVLGSPKREDWKLDAILDRLAEDARSRKISPDVALIPDLPYFNSLNFQLYARLRGLPSQVEHRQSAGEGIKAFDGINYVILTEKEQGMNWTTMESSALNRIVLNEPRRFRLLGTYPLPNGDTAHLFVILPASVIDSGIP
jgi:4-amino-4-deoxy-L-arabinose transferase-like glycosyltransferase